MDHHATTRPGNPSTAANDHMPMPAHPVGPLAQRWSTRTRGAVRAASVVTVGGLALVACGGSSATTPDRASAAAPTTVVDAVVDPTANDPAVVPVVADAWARRPAAGQTAVAAYVSFANHGDHDVSIRGVSSTLGDAEFHETVADADGVMRMRHLPDGVVVPANGALTMAPGGIHVMVLDADVLTMTTGGSVPLVFDVGPLGTVEVHAAVRSDTDAGDTDAADHDHAAGGRHPHQHGHDHGGGDPANDADVDDADVGPLDPGSLHALDDELHAGVLDVDRQRPVVARARAAALAIVADGTGADAATEVAVSELLEVLDRLDAALVDGDRLTAAALAFEAHDLAHALVPHHHHH